MSKWHYKAKVRGFLMLFLPFCSHKMLRGGTVQPASIMNPRADAEAVDKAFKGPGK